MRPFTPEDFAQCWRAVNEMVPITQGATLGAQLQRHVCVPGGWHADDGRERNQRIVDSSWLVADARGRRGQKLAEWMTHGESEWDVRQVNLHRFHRFQTTKLCVRDWQQELHRVVGDRASAPAAEQTARRAFVAVSLERWQSLGTSFTSFAGWSCRTGASRTRACWRNTRSRFQSARVGRVSIWSRIQGAEHLETRENVALFDLTRAFGV